MTEANHGPPVVPDGHNDENGDEISDHDVGIEEVSFDVTDSEHAEEVTLSGFDVLEIVDDIDGDEDAAGENDNASEKPAKEAVKTEESDCVEANLVQKVGLFGVREGR
jgi:hypothetical protein